MRIALSLAATMAAAFLISTRDTAAAASTASAAPPVEWRLVDGSVIRLADSKGRVVLVDFWASWCPPCKDSFPALDAIQREYRDKGVNVIAVNVDERHKDAEAFLAAHPHQMLVVFDPHGESPRAFRVRGMPSSFVIDRQEQIRYMHQGYSQGIDAAYRQELNTLLAEPAR
jgi:thiol-disulfide isomerase/thioredoxin